MIGFSGFDDDALARRQKWVSLHGGRVAESAGKLHSCTHVVVAKPVKRTLKLLIAVSLQRSAVIVTDDWLRACESAKSFVDATPYRLTGRHASAGVAGPQWAFDATVSRARALERRFLEGRRVVITDKVKPKPSELALIVEAAGGTVLRKPPKDACTADAPLLVVTTDEERKAWAPLAKQPHVTCIRAEHLLSCVLAQELVLGAAHELMP